MAMTSSDSVPYFIWRGRISAMSDYARTKAFRGQVGADPDRAFSAEPDGAR